MLPFFHVLLECQQKSVNKVLIKSFNCEEYIDTPRNASYATRSMITKKNVWVRIAAHGPNIKEGNKHGWRCYFRKKWEGDEISEEIPLANCIFEGKATQHNSIFGTNPKGGTRMSRVVGWLDLFGDVEIGDDDVLWVTLQDPKESAS